MNINNMSNDQLVNNLLTRGLDATAARSKAISSNIANINTAGYKRKYVTFEENLKNSIDNLELKTDSKKHMKLGNDYGAINTNTDDSTSMRSDGNNVDIEVETVNQAANELMQDALITLENNRLSMRKTVISGN
ncbi:flagellar basal body rod protein FlgB [Clostridium autoethanogenum]|uniref:Flagellar basal body rod protein FlgB n=1 Tax=Clostridium autoethanogenum TaxID=84023 RepID=A0A3M0T2Z2_9CLOT|nr:flagellar basal body rod protein FlgB [Clostridium autoethanogenum]RMD04302.1 flagellar basal body rod protein FlgB [Clostridium autoethanogenum]